jgi:hypothetical protein
MKRLKSLLLAAMLVLFSAGLTLGSDVSTHVVNFDFQQINEISIAGSPNLNISSAVAGQDPFDATDSSSTCAITTNDIDKRITASIDIAMPAFVTLKVYVVAPPGSGISQGYVPLTPSASDVVTGISQVADNSMTITYKLSATVGAGVLSTDTRTVTFTLSD